MSFRNTLIALIILLIIGGYAFVNYHFAKPVEAKTALDIKPEQIAKIDLKYPGREIVLERKPGKDWIITQPIGAKADQTTVNNLARAIADAAVTETVEQHPSDLARFGLAKPAAIVTVTTTRGKTLPGIEVGRTTPIGFSAYIKLTSAPAVMLTSSAFPIGMNKTLDQLRDRQLMTFKTDDVKRFTIDNDNGQQIEVARAGSKWNIVKPASYAADSGTVEELLRTLANVRVTDFVADAPVNVAQYGLQRPRVAVTVYEKDGEQQSLLFGSKENGAGKNGVYVRRGEETPIYALYPWEETSIDKTVSDLRDKTVLGSDPLTVESAEVVSNGERFQLKRTAAGWNVIENGVTAPANGPAVESFLDHIRDLKGNSIVLDPMKHPEMFGMNAPAVVVSLTARNGAQIGQLKLSKIQLKPAPTRHRRVVNQPAPSTEYYATSSASRAVFSADDYMFNQLAKSADQFKAKSTARSAPAKGLPSRPAAASSPAT